MPRNGTGGYSLPNNSWNPAINGAAATAADWQNLINDVATAIQQSVSADGQTTMTGSLQMGGFTISGLGAPTGVGQALRWEQLTKGADIASAAALPIPNEGAAFDVTGTTTITSFSGAFPGRIVYLRFMAAPIITNSASLILPNGKNMHPYPGEVYAFENVEPGVWQCVGGTTRLPSLYRSGGTVTRSTTSCTIAEGAWRSLGDETNIVLTSAISKTLQSSGAWAAGSGNNGLFTGARVNSTMYYLFVIRNDSDGSVDAGFDTSITANNRPVGYSAYRRVAACWFATGTFAPCVQSGDEFLYSPRLMLFSNAGWGSGWNSGAPVTAPVPAGVPVELHMKATLGTSTNLMAFGPTGSSGTPPSGGFDVIGQAAGGSGAVTVPVDLPVSDGKIVIYLSSAVASGTWCALTGYRDFLGD